MKIDLKSKAMPVVATAVTVASAVPAFCAETSDTTSIVTAMTSAFSTAASDCMSAISSILPVAIPVVGAIAVIGIGIKIFKKVTGK